MRFRVWCVSLVLASLGVACGDQPTEVVPEQEMSQGPTVIAAATSSSDDGLSITTDKDDYAPGDTVWFTGAGWQASDTLDILLEDEPATHAPHTWWVPVGEDGTFRDSTYVVDVGDIGVMFTLTATSRSTGRTLTVIFTDARAILGATINGSVPPPAISVTSGASVTVVVRGATTCAGMPATCILSGGATSSPSDDWQSTKVELTGPKITPPFAVQTRCDNGINVVAPTPAAPTGATHTFNFNAPTAVGTYDIQFRMFEMDNCAGNMSGALNFANGLIVTAASNQAPIARAGGPYSGEEGTEIELDGSSSSDPDNDTPLTYTWSIVLPLNAAFDGGSCSLDAPTSAKPKITCDDDGEVKVRLTVTDSKGLASAAASEATVTVTNADPTANAGGPYSGNEGSAISLTGSGNDNGENDESDLTFAWSVNKSGIDGTGDCTFSPNNTAQNPTITCTDDSEAATGGHFTVSLTVRDDDGGVSEVSTTNLTVNNVAPVIQSLKTGSTGTLDLPTTVVVGTTLEIKVTFGDNGSTDSHKGQIDCGSGSYGAESSVTSPFTKPCSFNSIGKKTVNVKVTDDDTQNNSDVESHEVLVVYDFDGFFAPVDRPTTLNISKAGQAIPLKWRLTDADGVGVTTLTAVAVKAVGIGCVGYATSTDQIEEYAAGSSALQNLGDGYYQFNWKTPTGYANSCKNIALTFGTGYDSYTEEPSALFSFKK